MLCVVKLNVVILSVIKLNVVMLKVMAPQPTPFLSDESKKFSNIDSSCTGCRESIPSTPRPASAPDPRTGPGPLGDSRRFPKKRLPRFKKPMLAHKTREQNKTILFVILIDPYHVQVLDIGTGTKAIKLLTVLIS